MMTSKGPYSLRLPHYWKFILLAFLVISSGILFFERYWQIQSPETQEINLDSSEKLEGVGKVDVGSTVNDDTTTTSTSTTTTTIASITNTNNTIISTTSTISPNQASPSPADLAASLQNGANNPTVNLVMATMRDDDISWTRNIQIPNLNIIRYISDDLDAKYHPPVPKKGHEALIYHTYMHDFYDDLPDISIFTHADDSSWHVDTILNNSMAFSLSHLDLEQVMLRQYFNLRVAWLGGCPDWINTTKGVDDSQKAEEPYMHQAFMENFDTTDDEVPEILGGPCCSQFAATRDAIRRHPKSQYRKNMDWLILTTWTDYITGRVWEHMWTWLFKGEAVDCEVEWQSYCRMYHICFGPASREKVWGLEKEKNRLKRDGVLGELMTLLGGEKAQRRLDEIDAMIAAELEEAIETGKSEAGRANVLADLL